MKILEPKSERFWASLTWMGRDYISLADEGAAILRHPDALIRCSGRTATVADGA